MGDEDKVIEREDLEPSTGMDHAASTYQETQLPWWFFSGLWFGQLLAVNVFLEETYLEL